MKIGDRVFVHGYIDEIRKDTIIIRNNGGYFGTVPSEVMVGELPSAERKGTWIGKPIAGYCTVRCSVCGDVFLENSGKWNFCPNCGADMRGEEE